MRYLLALLLFVLPQTAQAAMTDPQLEHWARMNDAVGMWVSAKKCADAGYSISASSASDIAALEAYLPGLATAYEVDALTLERLKLTMTWVQQDDEADEGACVNIRNNTEIFVLDFKWPS